MPFRATLAGDGALSREAMTPLVTPLRRRGALVEGTGRAGDEVTAPLAIEPLPDGRLLSRIEYESPAASADVKAAVLISGLRAGGATLFKEPTVSRDHTERLLDALGAPIRTFGTVVQLDPSAWDGHIAGFEFAIPGDLSAAAFLILAANLVPGSRVTARAVSVNPTRSGLLEIARDMGAGLTIEPQGERQGEPVAALHAWRAGLRAATVGGETVARANDDIPVACALAARASGTSRVTFGDGELGAQAVRRRVAPLLSALRSFGVQCDERPGSVEIAGREEPLRAARIESGGDPSLAMTMAILALVADGPTRIEDAACIGSRYPKFVATLRALGARVDVEGESKGKSTDERG